MIIGSLKDTQRIASFHPLFKTLFDFLANNDLSNIQLGKTELLKNKLYIICSTLEKGASREQLLEGHRKYIDVHILLEGKDTDTPSVFIDVNPGEFVIVYPEDLHAPGIGDGKIRKLVAKVLLDS